MLTDTVFFLLAALLIASAGVRLTTEARYIARATGLSEALLGGVIIGVITSLAGTVTSARIVHHHGTWHGPCICCP